MIFQREESFGEINKINTEKKLFSLAFIYVACYNFYRTFLKGGFSYEG